MNYNGENLIGAIETLNLALVEAVKAHKNSDDILEKTQDIVTQIETQKLLFRLQKCYNAIRTYQEEIYTYTIEAHIYNIGINRIVDNITSLLSDDSIKINAINSRYNFDYLFQDSNPTYAQAPSRKLLTERGYTHLQAYRTTHVVTNYEKKYPPILSKESPLTPFVIPAKQYPVIFFNGEHKDLDGNYILTFKTPFADGKNALGSATGTFANRTNVQRNHGTVGRTRTIEYPWNVHTLSSNIDNIPRTQYSPPCPPDYSILLGLRNNFELRTLKMYVPNLTFPAPPFTLHQLAQLADFTLNIQMAHIVTDAHTNTIMIPNMRTLIRLFTVKAPTKPEQPTMYTVEDLAEANRNIPQLTLQPKNTAMSALQETIINSPKDTIISEPKKPKRGNQDVQIISEKSKSPKLTQSAILRRKLQRTAQDDRIKAWIRGTQTTANNEVTEINEQPLAYTQEAEDRRQQDIPLQWTGIQDTYTYPPLQIQIPEVMPTNTETQEETHNTQSTLVNENEQPQQQDYPITQWLPPTYRAHPAATAEYNTSTVQVTEEVRTWQYQQNSQEYATYDQPITHDHYGLHQQPPPEATNEYNYAYYDDNQTYSPQQPQYYHNPHYQ